MKIICAFCGKANSATAQACAQCGGSLANARRERFRISWASWVPAIPVAVFLWFQSQQAQQEVARARVNREQILAAQKDELAKMRVEDERREGELEAKHRATMSDARLISGAAAAERHASEWKRRQSHDPEFARSLLEKTLLEVERVGKDPKLTAEEALRKVAELVTPPRSRVEVKPTEGNSFVVRVAYRLSAVRPEEAGGATHHTTSAEMRAEIEHVTAQVLKDIFDYCGTRKIERLSVSCNRALVIGKDENQRLVMRSLFRAVIEAPTAATISSWRDMSASEAANLMQVEHDVVAGIIITANRGPALIEDPNAPLEF